ncbi:MAG: hypothetical protein K0R67_2861, partial [Paenibacillus sp.]|nr:hypothetical protein [Paenibacillus sp.]
MTHKQPEEGDGDRWDAKWSNQRISRRKLLASVGATGAVLAVAGFLGGRLHSLGARTAQSDITALNNSACVEVNVKHFGAVGDGVTDDTVSVQQSLDSLPQGGGTVLFPVGTYLITRSLSVKTDNVTIIGSGRASKLIYTYEQTSGDNSFTASLLAFKSGIRGVTVKDLHLQYTGPYYPNFGDSYKGKVSGLRFMQCSDVRIEHVEISGFNSCAIDVATGYASRYANRFKVHQCYLHHNRVSGVRYGYVENISITDCDLDYHGSELDGGTGYGCCGYSEEVPLNVQIIGNRASYNYRKGIDLHAGKQSIIEGNLCHGNRLYGIYAEGVNAGNTLIRGNIISGMDRKTIGIPEPYTWITGIDFGCASSALTEEQ